MYETRVNSKQPYVSTGTRGKCVTLSRPFPASLRLHAGPPCSSVDAVPSDSKQAHTQSCTSARLQGSERASDRANKQTRKQTYHSKPSSTLASVPAYKRPTNTFCHVIVLLFVVFISFLFSAASVDHMSSSSSLSSIINSTGTSPAWKKKERKRKCNNSFCSVEFRSAWLVLFGFVTVVFGRGLHRFVTVWLDLIYYSVVGGK